MHVSLDGYVAGPNGEMDWIHVDEDMFEFAGKRTYEADTALYGRVTYQMMDSYWPTAGDQPHATRHDIEHSKWYNKVEKVVLSRSMQGQNLPKTKIIGQEISREINELKNKAGKEILIFGSPTAVHTLMKENLIDDYWLFINPVVLEQGIPLVRGAKDRIKLSLIETHSFASGVVCLHYENKNG